MAKAWPSSRQAALRQLSRRLSLLQSRHRSRRPRGRIADQRSRQPLPVMATRNCPPNDRLQTVVSLPESEICWPQRLDICQGQFDLLDSHRDHGHPENHWVR